MMNEKAFKTMGSAGAADIAVGLVVIALGIAAGVISVVNGVRLLRNRKGLTF